ncbi:MAG: CaiB/BaiF CoA transferase family protein [Lautropia sp.]
MAQDFSGIRVLDFSQVIAGPFAAQQLALGGADVVKVEPVDGGDQMRGRMLPSPLGTIGMASPFLTLNLGKRSLALDLKHPDGKAIALRLVASADVMIHNFRAGVVDRLGLDHDTVQALNPRIVCCAISGYGNEGPRSRDAAFDGAIQAASGMMANNGDPATGPMRTGYFPVDMMTGMSAAFAVASALVRRERTGRGKSLDVAMLDAAITMQASAFAQCLVDGMPGGLVGNSSATRSPAADRFETGDGLVLMSAVSQAHVAVVCDELGVGALMDDPRYATPAAREANASSFRAHLLDAFARDSAVAWTRRLGARGVPVSRVASIAEALEEPQLAHRDVIVEVAPPTGVDRPVRLVGAAFKASEDGPASPRPPPALGEHSREILREAGVSADEIERLIDLRVVGAC